MSLTCIKTGRCGSCYASTASHLHQHISIDVAGAGGTHCSCRINVGILVSQRTTADRHVTKHWNMGYTDTHTHTHPFNDPLSGTTGVSRYPKNKTNLDFTEARDSEWQWHQLGHMQVCISLQTDNHASNPPLSFFTGRMPFLLPNQQHQSTEGQTHTQTTQKYTSEMWARGNQLC